MRLRMLSKKDLEKKQLREIKNATKIQKVIANVNGSTARYNLIKTKVENNDASCFVFKYVVNKQHLKDRSATELGIRYHISDIVCFVEKTFELSDNFNNVEEFFYRELLEDINDDQFFIEYYFERAQFNDAINLHLDSEMSKKDLTLAQAFSNLYCTAKNIYFKRKALEDKEIEEIKKYLKQELESDLKKDDYLNIELMRAENTLELYKKIDNLNKNFKQYNCYIIPASNTLINWIAYMCIAYPMNALYFVYVMLNSQTFDLSDDSELRCKIIRGPFEELDEYDSSNILNSDIDYIMIDKKQLNIEVVEFIESSAKHDKRSQAAQVYCILQTIFYNQKRNMKDNFQDSISTYSFDKVNFNMLINKKEINNERKN